VRSRGARTPEVFAAYFRGVLIECWRCKEGFDWWPAQQARDWRQQWERIPGIEALLGVSPISSLVREAPKRWGSCDARGNLRRNWRIVQAPPPSHRVRRRPKLVHLRHEHHTAAFWAALRRVMPEYEARRADLRRVGARLLW
jgi:predicted metal-dependent hydrolase